MLPHCDPTPRANTPAAACSCRDPARIEALRLLPTHHLGDPDRSVGRRAALRRRIVAVKTERLADLMQRFDDGDIHTLESNGLEMKEGVYY